LNKSDTDQQDRKRHGIVFEPMPIIGKHHVYPYSSQRRLRESLRGKMQPSCYSTSTARLFQAYFAAKIPVSRFVAKTWPAFRGLWRESGKQDAAVALQKRAPANEPEGNSCLAARRRVRRAQQPERSIALLSYRSGRREPQRSVPEGVRTA